MEKIHSASNNTLILLDEAELALHPRVQVKLLEFLKNKSEEKNLTIMVSTHSPTMIKATAKENIILLKQERHRTEIITPCYPATAIGDVDFENATIFDYIFFVEDDIARTVMKYMLKRYIELEPKHATVLCNIIPVGGFFQTAEMAINTRRRVFAQSKVYAIVDQDAFENLEDKPKFNQLLLVYSQWIKGFGFTPENWLINQLEIQSDCLKERIRREFRVEISNMISDRKYQACNSPKPRKKAKDKFDVVKDICSETSGNNKSVTEDLLIKHIVYEMPDGNIRGLFNPLFREN